MEIINNSLILYYYLLFPHDAEITIFGVKITSPFLNDMKVCYEVMLDAFK